MFSFLQNLIHVRDDVAVASLMQCAMAHPRPITGHVASKDLSFPALNLSRFPSSHKDSLFSFRQNNTVEFQRKHMIQKG